MSRAPSGDASTWLQRFARFGYASKAVVYLLVGVLAVQAAFGSSQATDSSGALRSIIDAPFGRVLLGLMAVGLFSYAAWRGYSALTNPENDSVWRRLYAGLTTLIYGGLGLEAARLALRNGGGGGGGDQASHWTARALAQPFGAWLVGVVGVGLLLFGVSQLVHAWKAELDDQLDLSRLSGDQRSWVVRVSRFGIAARGAVLLLIGGFVVKAALEFDASEARGVEGALRSLESQPYGSWLLAAVALGLAAYGVYELVRARYRRIRVPDGLPGRDGTAIRLERR